MYKNVLVYAGINIKLLKSVKILFKKVLPKRLYIFFKSKVEKWRRNIYDSVLLLSYLSIINSQFSNHAGEHDHQVLKKHMEFM